MLIESVGINPEASRLAGVRSRTIIWTVYVFSRPVRRHRRPDDRRQHQRRRRQQRRPVDRARRDPRGRHRRHVAGRRPVLADRHAGRRAAHPDARHDDPQHRRSRRRPTTCSRPSSSSSCACVSRPRRARRFRCDDRRRRPRPQRRRRHEHRHRRPAPAPGSGSARCSPPSQYLPVLATFALFVGMFAAGGIRYEGFASPQVILNLFVDNAFLIVLAVGMTFVILTGGIDLSVGSVVALSTMIAAAHARGRLAAGLVIVAGAAGRHRAGPADGAGDPLLRHPAVHRHAGRACSWPAGSAT